MTPAMPAPSRRSGGTVSQWNDLSGNARHLTQATTTLQPAYTASALNSFPGIHFINNSSSTQDSNMQTATFTLAQPFTIVAVFKSGTGGPNNNAAGMSAFGVLVDGDLTQAAANRVVMFMGRSDLANDAAYFAGGGASIDAAIVLAASTAYHYAVIFNGASSSSNINGTTTSKIRVLLE